MKLALSRYNNLTQRLITAVVGAVIVTACILFSEWTYFLVFFVVCLFSQLEFYRLVRIDAWSPLVFFGTFCGLLLYSLVFVIEKGYLGHTFYMAIFPVLSLIFLIKLYKKTEEKPFTNIAFTFTGIIYIALPLSLLHLITYSQGHYSWHIVIGLLLIQWASDTGAYFAGTWFGKRKLFERISPMKSWEGSIGGTIVALGMAFFLSFYFTDLSLEQWIIVTAIIVIAGTYGDLVESLFKRSVEIKDSGTKLPGHGGFLDRFDSFLLSIPFLVTYLLIF